MFWMIALGMIAGIAIEGTFPHFNLHVTGDWLMRDVIESVPRAPPQPVQQLLRLLWKFLAIAIDRLLVWFAPYSCLTFRRDSQITFAIFESSSVIATATF
jgi:hypothetical protein